MVKSSSPASAAGSHQSTVDNGGQSADLKIRAAKEESKDTKKGSRPQSPPSGKALGPLPLPTPPTSVAMATPTTAPKSKTNAFSTIFRPRSKVDSSKGADQLLNPSTSSTANSIRRSDSPVTINRSTSSVGNSSSSSYLHGSPPVGGGHLSGESHHHYNNHHHRPSMPSTSLVKDIKQMEAYLTNHQNHNHQQKLDTSGDSDDAKRGLSSDEGDHLSPSTSKPSTTTFLPHPGSTASLTSMTTGGAFEGFKSSPSPSPLPSPVSPVAASAANAATPTAASVYSSSSLRRPSSIAGGSGSSSGGGGVGTGGRVLVASSSFTSGGSSSSSSSPGGGGIDKASVNSNASMITMAKYNRKELKGPYGKLLEAKMRNPFYPQAYYDCGSGSSINPSTSTSLANRNSITGVFLESSLGNFASSSSSKDYQASQGMHYLQARPPTISFTDELLRQTKNQRAMLDESARETVGTASPTEHKPEFPTFGGDGSCGGGGGDMTNNSTFNEGHHPHHSSTEVEESEESEEETKKKLEAGNASPDNSNCKNSTQEVNSRQLPPTVVVTEVPVSAGPSITEAIGRHLVSFNKIPYFFNF